MSPAYTFHVLFDLKRFSSGSYVQTFARKTDFYWIRRPLRSEMRILQAKMLLLRLIKDLGVSVRKCVSLERLCWETKQHSTKKRTCFCSRIENLKIVYVYRCTIMAFNRGARWARCITLCSIKCTLSPHKNAKRGFSRAFNKKKHWMLLYECHTYGEACRPYNKTLLWDPAHIFIIFCWSEMNCYYYGLYSWFV